MLCFSAGSLIAPGIPVGNKGVDPSIVRGAFKHGIWWSSNDNGLAVRLMRADVKVSPFRIVPEVNSTARDILIHINHRFVLPNGITGDVSFLTTKLIVVRNLSTIYLLCSELVGDTHANWHEQRVHIAHHGDYVTYRTEAGYQKVDLFTQANGRVGYRVVDA